MGDEEQDVVKAAEEFLMLGAFGQSLAAMMTAVGELGDRVAADGHNPRPVFHAAAQILRRSAAALEVGFDIGGGR